jgi:hypothetical protein
MNFGDDIGKAAELLKEGNKVKRRGWRGYLILKAGLIEHKGNGKTELYKFTQADVLAEDWWIVPE